MVSPLWGMGGMSHERHPQTVYHMDTHTCELRSMFIVVWSVSYQQLLVKPSVLAILPTMPDNVIQTKTMALTVSSLVTNMSSKGTLTIYGRQRSQDMVDYFLCHAIWWPAQRQLAVKDIVPYPIQKQYGCNIRFQSNCTSSID